MRTEANLPESRHLAVSCLSRLGQARGSVGWGRVRIAPDFSFTPQAGLGSPRPLSSLTGHLEQRLELPICVRP